MSIDFANHEKSRLDKALLSLKGLSVGDSFGERFFVHPNVVKNMIAERALPRSPWRFTDDTMMALSIYSTLRQCGHIDQDRLMNGFISHYDDSRGYGPAMHRLMQAVKCGEPWKEAALWCAGTILDNYEEALWLTVSGEGDRDTTCAIVGGIVAAFVGDASIPKAWISSVEPLPEWAFHEDILAQ